MSEGIVEYAQNSNNKTTPENLVSLHNPFPYACNKREKWNYKVMHCIWCANKSKWEGCLKDVMHNGPYLLWHS